MRLTHKPSATQQMKKDIGNCLQIHLFMFETMRDFCVKVFILMHFVKILVG